MTYAVFSGYYKICEGGFSTAFNFAVGSPGALVFDLESGRVVDIDPRNPPAAEETPRPGRPRLGVVAREVTLLPRHWDWLAGQPGGASVALRKLVEEASKSPASQKRAARDAAYRLATALVGDAPGYEEAMRGLYAGNADDFAAHIEAWPPDVRAVLEKMTATAF